MSSENDGEGPLPAEQLASELPRNDTIAVGRRRVKEPTIVELFIDELASLHDHAVRADRQWNPKLLFVTSMFAGSAGSLLGVIISTSDSVKDIDSRLGIAFGFSAGSAIVAFVIAVLIARPSIDQRLLAKVREQADLPPPPKSLVARVRDSVMGEPK